MIPEMSFEVAQLVRSRQHWYQSAVAWLQNENILHSHAIWVPVAGGTLVLSGITIVKSDDAKPFYA